MTQPVSLQIQRLTKEVETLTRENYAMEKALMRMLLERDRARAEVDTLKRREIIYKIPQENNNLLKNGNLSRLLDWAVHERNQFEELLLSLQHDYDSLLQGKGCRVCKKS